jgi:exodeoxyribonuclease VII small subunit
MDDLKKPEEMNYEDAFGELKELVSQLESSELPLERSLSLFERGQALAARCSALLEEAELKLKRLIPDDEGGYQEEKLE